MDSPHKEPVTQKAFPCHEVIMSGSLHCHNGHDGVLNHQPHGCLLNHLFRCRSKKTSKLHVTGLCAGNSPGTGEFPAQRASNVENVSIWWRHHGSYDPGWSLDLIFHVIVHMTTTWCILGAIDYQPIREPFPGHQLTQHGVMQGKHFYPYTTGFNTWLTTNKAIFNHHILRLSKTFTLNMQLNIIGMHFQIQFICGSLQTCPSIT